MRANTAGREGGVYYKRHVRAGTEGERLNRLLG